MNDETQDLISIIANRSMEQLARLACHTPNLDHARLCKALRSEVKDGIQTLLAELKEADGAFFGNNGMLNLTINVGCLEFAAKAWRKYQEAA